ncbi:putative P2Y purinoceptor 10 [Hemicordylus capensis]|uniref:putative P2Y purinoceptor 10 n=1 Tax=Hemicordylus capensis TaxID=884348 RepID=UPI002302B221|nr:putative P2Y purinoceptor 10 [Hemicordylus capensis]
MRNNLSEELAHPTYLGLNGSAEARMLHSTTQGNCTDPGIHFQHSLYAVTYTVVLIPGLLANMLALWMLSSYIRKRNKTIIFLVNLALADLAHIMSLPLRIYYYINNVWPFGLFLCQFCFYLKYLNMYASICFLTCISIQRYLFLLYPFKAKNWKRRYDISICVAIWIISGASCLTFPLSRKFENPTSCFTELGIKTGNKVTSLLMVTLAEFFGFVIPLVAIVYCTWKTKMSLQEPQIHLQSTSEKQKALRMIAMCAVVFFVCFTPYHVVFFFYMLVKNQVITNCASRQSILYLHPFCLSLASFNSCLDPVLYFFTTSEFRRISRHSSLAFRSRLMSKESASSVKE